MTSDATRPLDGDPADGQRLIVEGQAWTVVDHSTHRLQSGDAVDEWECQGKSGLAYVLKEPGDPPRWFFTREIPPRSVTLDGQQRIDHWFQDAGASPPPALHYRGRRYLHDETARGSYEEDPGEATAKTTWEFWDEPREWNLAVERGANGAVRCYHGRYVERDSIRVRPDSGIAPVVALFIVTGLFALVLPLFGLALDWALTAWLAVIALVGFLSVISGGPAVALPALVAALVFGVAFWSFPPLTSVAGLVVLIAGAFAFARWLGVRGAEVHPRAVFSVVALPVVVAGAYHYFWFAPGPHTVGQYLLALGPAPLAGLVATLIARLVARKGPVGASGA